MMRGRGYWLVPGLLMAATLAAQSGPNWRKVGGTSLDLFLASPASGPVSSVWYSPDGSRLYVRAVSGRVFETLDFENWTPATAADPGTPPALGAVERIPDAGARLASFPSAPGRIYALGRNLFRSEDGGRSWMNLTAYKNDPVIGGGQRAVAIPPQDAEQLVVANDFGVWRSLDGGLSWTGLNQYLPNLPPSRIVTLPQGARGTRIAVASRGTFELPAGGTVWEPVADDAMAREAARLEDLSGRLGAAMTAVAQSGDTVYAGSADGRLWVSLDSGRTWQDSPAQRGGSVERIFVDAAQPRVAVAALAGSGAHILRTTNSGGFWDDLTSNLGDTPAHAVAADRSSGTIYAATDRGVFMARADLENPASPANVNWIPLNAGLPSAAATDVKLDAAGNQLYVALDGYGLYAAMAPHRASSLRLVNAADFSTRAAAPGSLVSVVGGRVSAARSGSLDFPVLAASDNESQIQVPFEATGANLPLALQTARGAVNLGLPVRPVSPAIFVSRDGDPMLLDGDSGLMLDPGNPARSGTRLQILATGLGRVTPDWPTGLAAPLENAPAVVADIKAYLDRVPMQVTRASLAPGYIGFYLIEVQLPAVVNAGPAELYLSAGGVDSNRVRVFLQP